MRSTSAPVWTVPYVSFSMAPSLSWTVSGVAAAVMPMDETRKTALMTALMSLRNFMFILPFKPVLQVTTCLLILSVSILA